MIYHVLDNQFNALTMIDTDAENGIVVANDIHAVELVNGTQLNTLSMDLYKNTGPRIDEYDRSSPFETSMIKEGCYIVFRDDNENNVCLYIREIGNETEEVRPISAVDLGVELRNGNASTFPSERYQYIDYYINRELYDTGWEIGVNELEGNIKKLVDTSTEETPLARLQSVCEVFDCEMTFTVEFQNTKITKKLINIYFKIGNDKVDKTMYSGVDVETISKTVNIDDVITALRDTNKGFNGLVIGDGRFYTQIGESIVYDRVANAEYGNGNTSKERFTGWRIGITSSDYNSQIENYNQIRNMLEERSQPQFSADVNFLFNDSDFEIGDYITFIDEEYNPPLRIKARVIRKEINRSDQSENTATISNIERLKSLVSSDLQAKQKEKNKLDSQYSLKLFADNGTSFIDGEPKITIITAHVFQNGQDITNTIKKTDLLWTKVDKNGNHDTVWENRYQDAGVTVKVVTEDVTEIANIHCTLTKFENHFVQGSYFINGLKDMARKILKMENKNTVTSAFISDTHYATNTIVRDDLENYSRSNDHIKNVAELTHFVGMDYIVHGGDVHDGSTDSKDVAKSNFKKCISTLGLAKCPYFVAWGNHDSNALGDKRSDARRKPLNWYKPRNEGETRMIGRGAQQLNHTEMYEIATRPSTIFDIVENPDDKMGYYYYDVPKKNVRVIILNSQDTPQYLEGDGYLRYLDSGIAGYRQKQIDWFYQTLKATPTDRTVCIYQHKPFGDRYQADPVYYPYNYEMIDGIVNSFVTGGKYSGSFSANKDFKASISCDFEGRKGTLAFLAAGHKHNDRINVDSRGIHSYNIGCSVSRPKYDQGDRPLGEIEEDLWDVVMVDTARRHVDLLRFGQGEDRSFDY
ncbi:metallophosphoesterase [Tetragenococcus halophilus]|uniref:metallophosphoesterase n=1 Tax=Tetragenococcus halophilus TaxID=51669 RepID=UPI00077CA1EE|nr:metallophosphoesterase [Tetragenococcus halophilus]